MNNAIIAEKDSLKKSFAFNKKKNRIYVSVFRFINKKRKKKKPERCFDLQRLLIGYVRSQILTVVSGQLYQTFAIAK